MIVVAAFTASLYVGGPFEIRCEKAEAFAVWDLKKLIETGVGEGPAIIKVVPPERENDGKRCHVLFDPPATAVKYNLWVSPYADGRGAVLLGKDWTKPGQLLTALIANFDLYIFVMAIDSVGVATKPGKAFKVNLKDRFPMR